MPLRNVFQSYVSLVFGYFELLFTVPHDPLAQGAVMVQNINMSQQPKADTRVLRVKLVRLAQMFRPHRDSAGMRELCRLAIKCAQERWIGD